MLLGRFLIAGALLLPFSLSIALAADDEFQTWTDVSGKFELRAKFIELKDDIVYLEDEDGERMEIELDALNAGSRVAAQKAAMSKPKSASPFKRRGSSSDSMERDESDDVNTTSRRRRGSESDGPRLLKLTGSNLKKLNPLDEEEQWNVIADGVEAETGLFGNGLVFKGRKEKFDDFDGVVIAPKVGLMVWAHAASTSRSEISGRISTLSIIDTKTGDEPRQIDVPQRLYPLDISADGQTLLTALSTGSSGRDKTELVAWDISGEEAKPIWACQPFITASMFNKEVVWARFLPDDRVAVMSSGNLIGVFETTRAKRTHVIVSTNGESGTFSDESLPGVSPGGKYVAVCNGRGLAVYETVNLTAAGALLLPEGFSPKRVKFSTDGKELMLLGNESLLVYDVETGEQKYDVPKLSKYSASNTVSQTADGFYLVGDTLVDAEQRMPVWTYENVVVARRFGEKVVLGFDRSWVFGGESLVAGVSAPSNNTLRILEQLKARPDLYALKPGGRVGLDVSQIEGGENQRLVRKAIEDWADQHDILIDDSADRTFVATMVAGKPKTVTYFKSDSRFFTPLMFRDKSEGTPVTHTPYTARLELKVGNESVWRKGAGFEGYQVTVKEGQSIAAAVQEARQPRYGVFKSFLPEEGTILKQAYVDGAVGVTKATAEGLEDEVKTKL